MLFDLNDGRTARLQDTAYLRQERRVIIYITDDPDAENSVHGAVGETDLGDIRRDEVSVLGRALIIACAFAVSSSPWTNQR